jgi:ATP adenylyltransferase
MKKTIWAPWRIEYIRSDKQEECFLCRLFSETDDRDNLLLRRGRTCAVVMNRYPYTGGHLLVAPYRHLADLADMTADEKAELMELTIRAVDILKAELKPDGLNLGFNFGSAAGAGLKDHLHQHIVPRWIGDTNFMPVIGDARVMPQALLEQYDALYPLFN